MYDSRAHILSTSPDTIHVPLPLHRCSQSSHHGLAGVSWGLRVLPLLPSAQLCFSKGLISGEVGWPSWLQEWALHLDMRVPTLVPYGLCNLGHSFLSVTQGFTQFIGRLAELNESLHVHLDAGTLDYY